MQGGYAWVPEFESYIQIYDETDNDGFMSRHCRRDMIHYFYIVDDKNSSDDDELKERYKDKIIRTSCFAYLEGPPPLLSGNVTVLRLKETLTDYKAWIGGTINLPEGCHVNNILVMLNDKWECVIKLMELRAKYFHKALEEAPKILNKKVLGVRYVNDMSAGDPKEWDMVNIYNRYFHSSKQLCYCGWVAKNEGDNWVCGRGYCKFKKTKFVDLQMKPMNIRRQSHSDVSLESVHLKQENDSD